MNQHVNFIVKFGISKKLFTLFGLRETFDLVENAFKCPENFPSKFKLQFMDEDVNELINLDSAIQLHDRENNELLVIPENTVTTRTSSRYEDEPISSGHFM